MSQVLLSSVPGIWAAALGLIQAAGAAQDPVVQVMPFDLGQYEPGSYVLLHEIKPVTWKAEDTAYSFVESYNLAGYATVFTGQGISGVDEAGVTLAVLQATYDLFQNVVMTPLVSNRLMPILGTTGPTPFQMLVGNATYSSGVGARADGKPWGWVGRLDWAFHFDAHLTPQNT